MKGDIKIEFTNDKELLALFNELQPKYQKKIVIQGLKDAARLIYNQAKTNLNRVKKGKSKQNYRYINSAFKIEALANKNTLGVKVGITKQGYKARWLEWGTVKREYTTKKNKVEHNTGSIQATNFFFSAVEAKKNEAQNKINDSITNAFNKVVEKYKIR